MLCEGSAPPRPRLSVRSGFTLALDCIRSLLRFYPPRSRCHPSPYQWDTDEVNTFNSMAIPPPPPPAGLWRKCWMAGSNFLIHLSGGWLTGSVLAKLMSRLLSSMHYSSSKHYLGDISAHSHVKQLNRSCRFRGWCGHTLLNRWSPKSSSKWAF